MAAARASWILRAGVRAGAPLRRTLLSAAASPSFGALSADQRALKDASRAYFMSELHPLFRRMDDDDWFPPDVWPALGAQGYFGRV